MGYSTPQDMAQSQSLQARISGCVAMEGEAQPSAWTAQHIWEVVSRSEWADAWDYATDQYNVNQNPDTGKRTDVINDGMILAAVQDVRGT